MLAFTPLGAKVDELVTGGLGPYSFCIQSEFYHKIRSLCLAEGQRPQFTQLYIHDTKHEHQNRHVVMPFLDPTTVGLVVDHDVQYQSLCQSVQNGKGYDGN